MGEEQLSEQNAGMLREGLGSTRTQEGRQYQVSKSPKQEHRWDSPWKASLACAGWTVVTSFFR